ncbi:MAG: hypothetical protein M1814_004177 [Vezdaea aestivalis]|nr:MAG: hypothetical protein M1814_004177 [Vezdaea aestivalis]
MSRKLHLTNTTGSRARGSRRESMTSMTASGSTRVRKPSLADNGMGHNSMRPRANTIGHVDGAALGLFQATSATSLRSDHIGAHSHHQSLLGFPTSGSFQYRGMSTAIGNHGNPLGLPKLDTHGLSSLDVGATLHTAPPFGNLELQEKALNDLFYSPASTVNPAQLHFSESPMSGIENGLSSFGMPISAVAHNPILMDDEDAFDWMNSIPSQGSISLADELAIDASSPSVISTASQSGISEVMLDGCNQISAPMGQWQQNTPTTPSQTQSSFSVEMPAFTASMAPAEMISPKTLTGQDSPQDIHLVVPSPLLNLDNSVFTPNDLFHPPMAIPYGAHVPIANLKTTSSTLDSITDMTREAMLVTLSQPSPFNHRKYSAPSISSPPPQECSRSRNSSASLPNTADLKRFVAAYIHYFQPHLPFLHIPTLSFESLAFADPADFIAPETGMPAAPSCGGEGSLVLAMAAIGALYESDLDAAKELFNASKKTMQLFLEQRKMEMLSPLNKSVPSTDNTTNTPLWIVQAMLLNVIYGHNCGDKMSSDVASTHCVALVNLARSAELRQPPSPNWQQSHDLGPHVDDIAMGDDISGQDPWMQHMEPKIAEEQIRWFNWKASEERNRTLYAVFILSSLLVSAYNHAPALSNSEILIDLPCEEEVWTAPDAMTWQTKTAEYSVDRSPIKFSDALAYLLSSSKREGHDRSFARPWPSFGSTMPEKLLPEPRIKVSTFGCLILINALHNYIWETRQRHHSRQWTVQETDSMNTHIEPALRAWQAAWAHNPRHSLERPNPYGMGPLSADSIPLLDLAYVRLFVNLGRSKEAFWQRDFDGMAEELASGSEVIQNTEPPPSSGSSESAHTDSLRSLPGSNNSPSTADSSPDIDSIKLARPHHPFPNFPFDPLRGFSPVSKRERHLRRAAFFAADSLSMSDKLGVTFADFASKELPLQSAMCQFDCSQVLAEWVATLQERVGQALGVLGRDEIEYSQIPASMLLEDEDCKLLQKITELLSNVEIKMQRKMVAEAAATVEDALASSPEAGTATLPSDLPSSRQTGFGSKILYVTAYMLGKSAVWPVTRLMAASLEIQAEHMHNRALKSIMSQR